MTLLNRLTSLFRGAKPDEFPVPPAPAGKSALQANMEKALAMKQSGAAEAQIPEHRTAHQGMQDESTRVEVERGEVFTPTLKRSKVARSGDAS